MCDPDFGSLHAIGRGQHFECVIAIVYLTVLMPLIT